MCVPVEMDVNDTVLKLKEKIHDMENFSMNNNNNNLVLHTAGGGTELHDHQLLRDCDVSDNSEIDVSCYMNYKDLSIVGWAAITMLLTCNVPGLYD